MDHDGTGTQGPARTRVGRVGLLLVRSSVPTPQVDPVELHGEDEREVNHPFRVAPVHAPQLFAADEAVHSKRGHRIVVARLYPRRVAFTEWSAGSRNTA